MDPSGIGQAHAASSRMPQTAAAAEVLRSGDGERRARADALSGSTRTGLFRIDVAGGAWWWSEETYAIYGFEPGEIVPTRELVLAHNHPEDRSRARDAMEHAHRSERPFSCLHRIVDAQHAERLVVTVGRGHRGTGDAIATVTGYVADLAGPVDRYAALIADGQIAEAARSRGVSERAKGVLCVTHDVDEDAAFAILRRASMRTNMPVRVLAGRLVDFVRHEARAGRILVRADVDAFLAHPGAHGPKA